jgi:CRP-like cAMP-binding protein
VSRDTRDDYTPVLKSEVKRGDVFAQVKDDPVLGQSGFVKAMGEKLELALKRGISRRYPDKVVLFQAGDSGSSLFFVLSGEVRLFAKTAQGAVELPAAKAGDVVGEAEVLDGTGLRAVAAAAHGTVEMTELSRESLVQAGKVPEALAAFLQSVRAARKASLDELQAKIRR